MADAVWDPGVVAKFTRAADLREELVKKQAEGRENAKFEYEMVNNFDKPTEWLAWQEWRLRSAPPEPDLSFSAVLGDLVHNLRACLDYCTWQAADETARASNPTAIQFPLFSKPADWRSWKKQKGRWYGDAVVQVFDDSQLFHSPTGKTHPLAVLQVLSNTDKHRLLNTARFGFMTHELFLDPEPSSYSWEPVELVPEVAGEVVARLEFPRPVGPRREVDVRVEFGWYECFRYEPRGEAPQWHAVDAMVDAMYHFTLNTVAAMQAAQSESGSGSE